MATVTIAGNTIRGATTSKDNRPWQVRAIAYQYGGIGGGVITPGADWETLYPVDGVLTFTAESGAVVDIKTPDEVPYRVRVPTSNAGLWDVIEAGVAYQPDVAQDNLNLAVANAAGGFIAAELGLQTADAIAADLAARDITFTDEGSGSGYFSVGGVPVSGTLVPSGAVWSSLAARPSYAADSVARDGATDDHDDLADDDDAALAFDGGLPLMLRDGVHWIESDLTIDSPVWFLPGAVIKPDSGVTVTLAGGIVNAPPSQIFDTSAGGSVVFGRRTDKLTPLWWGSVGDGSADDTDAIQGAIDAAKNSVRAGYGNCNLVVIPAGIYKITSTIIHPTYVKVASAGTVTFETYVDAAPAWWFAPLADDAEDFYAPLNVNQWLYGSPLNGTMGGISFVNLEGDLGESGTIGLELGSRSALGGTRFTSRYAMSDVTIQGYGQGIHFNEFDHFLGAFHRMIVNQCAEAVHIGTNNTGSNRGENFSWYQCVFASSVDTGGFFTWGEAAVDMNFYGCSFDFTNTVFKFNYGWQKVNVFGGHFEQVNTGDRNTSTGGIAVSNVSPSGGTRIPEVNIDGSLYVSGSNFRGVMFRGNMNLDVQLGTSAGAPDATALAYANSYLCDSSVLIRSSRNPLNHPAGGSSLSPLLNMSQDPFIAADADATAGSALTYWARTASNTTDVVDAANSPVVGGKCMKMVFTGSAYCRYTPKAYLPCIPGRRLFCAFAYKVPTGAPAFTMTIYQSWYDSEKVLIGSTTSAGNLTKTATVYDAWAVHDKEMSLTPPAGACFVKVGYQMSCSVGDGATAYRVSDFRLFPETS